MLRVVIGGMVRLALWRYGRWPLWWPRPRQVCPVAAGQQTPPQRRRDVVYVVAVRVTRALCMVFTLARNSWDIQKDHDDYAEHQKHQQAELNSGHLPKREAGLSHGDHQRGTNQCALTVLNKLGLDCLRFRYRIKLHSIRLTHICHNRRPIATGSVAS